MLDPENCGWQVTRNWGASSACCRCRSSTAIVAAESADFAADRCAYQAEASAATADTIDTTNAAITMTVDSRDMRRRQDSITNGLTKPCPGQRLTPD